ncbi:bifunctional 2-C-methyl-D-erythritol 4-phosphate cytidylyltransferase/2-C-methyl-D-erythritol 2,4-cyclodiphosphate synthase [Lichenibacterium ramalinae]|uniref:Bifunctional enzyme IspD/IspF n=1 Tax=Lichenibacterium ramalinae TaxID=2316527 RepID=A0A4Q2RCW5_9HYPH|nr:bifunctional 2-C-methyl-D-erythritol 4-phosphate cytidylyltransferase/2-C-methyl-D-erythritol 2,4-cyclodiphosphate synthase [Lichenibacterium ramalinae]RYB05028.1 bifunctional 2-C-methyl-D-erythritol 4-phosphate cytidylyltransferase/2-C-methyl-D-erythritol 2,4-cyclodiphosphate synthase [Lichenibacterium ramalinae]
MMERTHVLVVAAGRGSRAGTGLPKQYRALAGRPILARTLSAFLRRSDLGSVVTVIHADDRDLYDAAVAGLDGLAAPVVGGETRQDSVRAGLEALAARGAGPDDVVLIHDGARPFATDDLVDRAMAAGRSGAAVPGCPVFDTVKAIDADGRITGTPDRSGLRLVQTPQAFRFGLIGDAHARAAAEGRHDLTDDAAVAEFAGHAVTVFAGDAANVKLTTTADLKAAERRLQPTLADIRTGQGFDVHAFVEGDHVWLGGIRIPHTHKLSGHSDADVVLHALTDALLATIGDGDIGSHFPPSDMQWKGASSDRFLRHAAERVRARGGVIANINATIVCEAPRIGPHRDAMQKRIAEIAGIAPDRVGVTAGTSERMGFTGRGEGIVAWGLATVRLPAAAD